MRQLCAFGILLVCLAGIKLAGTPTATSAEQWISRTLDTPYDLPAELGKLTFLSAPAAVDASSSRSILLKGQWPVSSPISQSYNPLSHPGISFAHTGDVWSALDGEVFYVGSDAVYGEYVRIRHADGVDTLYYGVTPCVQTGDPVLGGQRIGQAEQTQPLYFQMYINRTAVDPSLYLPMQAE